MECSTLSSLKPSSSYGRLVRSHPRLSIALQDGVSRRSCSLPTTKHASGMNFQQQLGPARPTGGYVVATATTPLQRESNPQALVDALLSLVEGMDEERGKVEEVLEQHCMPEPLQCPLLFGDSGLETANSLIEDLELQVSLRNYSWLQGLKGGAHVVQAEMKRTEIPKATEIPEAAIEHHFCYKVKEGDTLTSIANKFKTTVQSIAVSNEIVDVDHILAGKLLLIPLQSTNSDGVKTMADFPSSLIESPQRVKLKNVILQTGSFPSTLSMLPSPFSFQTYHVNVALSLLVLFAIFSFVKRHVSNLETTKHQDVLRQQVEKEVQDAHHRPKLRRWQGILDEDQKVDELDGALLSDGQTILESEEEKLRQSYAQLESVYAKFLEDSGLSNSGYWRGGAPPAASEEED